MNFLFIKGIKRQSGYIALLNYLNNNGHTTYQFPKKCKIYDEKNEKYFFRSEFIGKNEIESERELRELLPSIDYVVCDRRYFDSLKDWKAKSIFHFFQYLFYYGFSFSPKRHRVGSNIVFYLKKYFDKKPIAILDFSDQAHLDPHDILLANISFLYIKRELLYDRYKAISGLWNLYFDKRLSRQKISEKFSPARLGINDCLLEKLKDISFDKYEYDVFWLGESSSSIRDKLNIKLAEISKKYNITINDSSKKIPEDIFYSKIKSSKIAISVDGAGWDCFRHYEIIALKVPIIITRPTVDIGLFFSEEMVNFVNPSLDDLESALFQILNNYDEYKKRAEAAYNFLLENFTYEKIGENIFNQIIKSDKAAQNKIFIDYDVRYR